MSRKPFSFIDICRDCTVEFGCHTLHGNASPKKTGVRIQIPPELMRQHPYNTSAYAFLQQLRTEILEYGTLEFPDLPVNKTNYTLAQRAPREHRYSRNPYLTGEYQHLHQDTPPYPTAFWLDAPRRYFATWVVSTPGLEAFLDYTRRHPQQSLQATHQQLVPECLANGTGVLLNHTPGLLLIDNSEQQKLYHARTAITAQLQNAAADYCDTPMYAFNEIGLLHYIDTLDEHRGQEHRCNEDKSDIQIFLAQENQ